MLDETGHRYGRVAILLHWTIAVLVLSNLALGLGIELTADAQRGALVRLHKSIGVTVLLISLARVAWRLAHKPGPSLTPQPYRRLAHAVHVAFYVLIVLLPLSGWTMISLATPQRPTLLWGLVRWPAIGWLAQQPGPHKAVLHGLAGSTHLALAILMAALVVLHVAGALWHSWRGEHGGLRTMLHARRR